jgi:hypothetical protein
VLALGNPGPADLPGTDELGGQYTSNPWAGSLSFTPGESVLLVGTGLTMADVTLAAAADTNDQITIYAMSRHGLTPPLANSVLTKHLQSGWRLNAARRIVLCTNITSKCP